MFASSLFSYLQGMSSSSSSANIVNVQSPNSSSEPIEILKNRIYFASFASYQDFTQFVNSNEKDSLVCFSIDRVLQYEPFCQDFGPLNLGKLYRFCQMLNNKLKDPQHKSKRIVVYTCVGGQKKRANLAWLLGGYQVLFLGRSAEEACRILTEDQVPYIPFRDASMGTCLYKCTLEHCVTAVQTAVKLGFFDFKSFDIESYEKYERVENGDLTVVVPGKFVHFSGPHDKSKDTDGYPTMTPEHYFPVFKKYNVTDVVRLNQACYDRSKFVKAGFKHHDLYFPDGSTPKMEIVEHFLEICEKAHGAIAVHCKAGLGRTGTVVGCYLMKHYHLTASEAIAWMRICRPGSVLGPQQEYLERMQSVMWAAGETSSIDIHASVQTNSGKVEWEFQGRLPSRSTIEAMEMDVDEEFSFANGEAHQGDVLMRQKTEAQKNQHRV
jgi:cell division cycle 14